jgi:hypothetical protein
MDPLDEQIQRSLNRDAVRDAVAALALALTDGHADPAENLEAEAATLQLADLLGNVSHREAAEGIGLALMHIWSVWHASRP